MGLFGTTKKKRSPMAIQNSLKKRLEKKKKLAQLKASNASLRASLAKLG